MASGPVRVFIDALDRWDSTVLGMFVVPLGIFVVGACVLILGCRFLERQATRLSEAYADITGQTFAWIRRLGLAILLCLCVGLLLQNVSDALLEGSRPTGMVRTTGTQLRRFARIVLRVASGGARLSLVILSAFWIARVLEGAVHAFFSRDKGLRATGDSDRATVRKASLQSTGTYVVRVGVSVVAFLVGMQTVGVSIGPLLATAGIVSVAIGLGAQTFIRDLVAGFLILAEDQFAVGDVIDLGPRGGMVEAFTLRVTKLRAADGSAIFIPNGEIKMVRNTTSEWARVDLRVRIGLQEDLPRVEALLKALLARVSVDLEGDILGEPEYLGVDKLEEKYAVLRAWVKTRPLSRHRVEREINARILSTFGANDVQFPGA